MNKNTTILLVLILAALLGVVYFTKGDPNKGARETQKMIDGYDTDKVTTLRIENGERNEKIVLTRAKAGADWEMKEPIQAAADRTQAEFLTRYFADYEGTRAGVATDASVNLDSLGLAKPRAILEIDYGKEKPAIIKIGADNPLKSGEMFLLVNDAVFRAPRTIYNTISKPAMKFRDERVFTIPSTDVTEIEIEWKGAKTTLARDGNAWRIAAPFKGQADSTAAGRMAGAISQLKVSLFEHERPGDLSIYQLTEPELIITVKNKDKSETLRVGRVDADQRAFCLRDNSKTILKIAEPDLVLARKSADDWRDPNCFGTFVYDSVTSLTWRTPQSGEVEFKYDTAARKASIVKPRSAAADRLAFDDLLKAFDQLKAESLIPTAGANLSELGLSPAAGYLQLTVKDGPAPMRLELGVERDGFICLKRAGDEYLLKVPATALAPFTKSITNYVSKDILSVDSYGAGHVELDIIKDGATRTLIFAKNDTNKWTVPGASEEAASFANLSDRLWHAKATEILNVDLKSTSLAKPSIEVRVYRKLYNDPKGDEKEKDRLATLRLVKDDVGNWLANGLKDVEREGGFVMKIAPELPEQILQLAGLPASAPANK